MYLKLLMVLKYASFYIKIFLTYDDYHLNENENGK